MHNGILVVRPTLNVAAPVAGNAVGNQLYYSGTAISTLGVGSDFTGSGITYTVDATSAALPSGLSLNTSTGDITGTPTVSASADSAIVIRGTNAGGYDLSSFTIRVQLDAIHVGGTGHFNATGSSEVAYQLTLPVGSAAGDTAIFGLLQAGSSAPTVPTNGTSLRALARLSTTLGENYNSEVCYKTLDATDISNGYVAMTYSLSNTTGIVVEVFRNVGSLVQANAFSRSASLAANSIDIVSETALKTHNIALVWRLRGGGRRTPTYPGSWAGSIVADDASSGAGRYVSASAIQTLSAAGASPTGTMSWSGSADMTITTLTVLIEAA